MRNVTLFAAALLAGCASFQPGSAPAPGADAARQLRVAAAAERSGQMDVALSLYGAAYEADPANPEIAQRFSNALLSVNETMRAREVLVEARRRHPTDAALLQAEGRVLLELGEAEAALVLFEAQLARTPRDARALNGRGIALDLLGRHAEARASYLEARAVEPRNPLWSGNLALSLMLSGCHEQAEALLASAPRSTATNEWLGQMQGLARTLSPSGGPREGAAELRAALPAGREPCPAIS
jgi:Flp pilus assembly protein TadD